MGIWRKHADGDRTALDPLPNGRAVVVLADRELRNRHIRGQHGNKDPETGKLRITITRDH